MPQADRDYLREYVRAQPSRQDDETLTAYLRRVGVDKGEPTDAPAPAQTATTETAPKATPQQRAQAREQARAAKAQADAAQAAADEATAREQARKQRNAAIAGRAISALGVPPNKAADFAESWRDRIANAPTPGGNGALLVILLFMIAFIVPVAAGGYTRAQLFWLTLLGRTKLAAPGEPDPGGMQKSPVTPTGIPKAPSSVTDTAQSANATTFTAQPIPMTLPLPGSAGGPQLPS